MNRRYGDRVDPAMRYVKRPGVYAILLQGSDILLTYQAGLHNEFQLPGGGVDPGEHPLPALHREVMEETGWGIRAARRIGLHRRFTYMPEYKLWAEKLCTLYLAQPTRAFGPPMEEDHDAVWVPARFAPDLLASPGDAAMLRDLLR